MLRTLTDRVLIRQQKIIIHDAETDIIKIGSWIKFDASRDDCKFRS